MAATKHNNQSIELKLQFDKTSKNASNNYFLEFSLKNKNYCLQTLRYYKRRK